MTSAMHSHKKISYLGIGLQKDKKTDSKPEILSPQLFN